MAHSGVVGEGVRLGEVVAGILDEGDPRGEKQLQAMDLLSMAATGASADGREGRRREGGRREGLGFLGRRASAR